MELGPEEQRDLLRRFEQVIRYTAGELFLPMAVADYVTSCALVAGTGQRRAVRAEPGTLTLDTLAQLGARGVGQGLSLEHVVAPLGRAQYRAWRRRPERVRFAASSRFAAVGLLARLVDAVFRVTLLLRGRVPGGFTAAAQVLYAQSPSYRRPTYYGRVVEDAGYVVLQYWYFYAMNDWRSTFGGVNDHEADWEQVTVFLVAEGEEVRPAWVAFSSHDEVGDDLRRRWDDPDMAKAGEHPVVFAGAGSHSGPTCPASTWSPPRSRCPGGCARSARSGRRSGRGPTVGKCRCCPCRTSTIAAATARAWAVTGTGTCPGPRF